MTASTSSSAPAPRKIGFLRSCRTASDQRLACLGSSAACARTVWPSEPGCIRVASPAPPSRAWSSTSTPGSDPDEGPLGRFGSLIADPGVQGRVEHVDHEVEEDVHEHEQ